MSWNVAAIGKSPAVRTEIAKQITRYKCSEPEESVKMSAAALLDAALASQKPDSVVSVSANGSQSQTTGADGTPEFTNSLTISVQPQYGFVE